MRVRHGREGESGAGEVAPARTWGPFTGRQLTTIVCTLIIVLGLPVGAWAVVSGTDVFVADATSGTRAKVDPGGNLQTKVNGTTRLLATSPASGRALPALGDQLTTLNLTWIGEIRVSLASSCSSASPIDVAIVHVDSPGTEDASGITVLDDITLAPCEHTSRTYEIPGQVIAMSAFPTNHQAGSTVYYTVHGR